MDGSGSQQTLRTLWIIHWMLTITAWIAKHPCGDLSGPPLCSHPNFHLIFPRNLFFHLQHHPFTTFNYKKPSNPLQRGPGIRPHCGGNSPMGHVGGKPVEHLAQERELLIPQLAPRPFLCRGAEQRPGHAAGVGRCRSCHSRRRACRSSTGRGLRLEPCDPKEPPPPGARGVGMRVESPPPASPHIHLPNPTLSKLSDH